MLSKERINIDDQILLLFYRVFVDSNENQDKKEIEKINKINICF